MKKRGLCEAFKFAVHAGGLNDPEKKELLTAFSVTEQIMPITKECVKNKIYSYQPKWNSKYQSHFSNKTYDTNSDNKQDNGTDDDPPYPV